MKIAMRICWGDGEKREGFKAEKKWGRTLQMSEVVKAIVGKGEE